MPEAASSRLETHRFVINPESLGAMKRVRDALPVLQGEFPYLKGVGFFGSRTKGMENQDSKISDLELCLFFDDTDYQGSSAYNNLMSAQSTIREITGLEIDPFLVNISRANTDSNIDMFSKIANYALSHGNSHLGFSLPVCDLMFQFSLAVGDDVYKNRAYILNKFKTLPQGEEYFQLLMDALTRTERSFIKYPIPDYEHMPKTIAEAEKYFLTKPGLLQDTPTAV